MDPRVSEVEIVYGDASLKANIYEWLPSAAMPDLEAVRLRIEIFEAVKVPKELFLWERHLNFTDTEVSSKDRFICVCKTGDLSVYPINNPDETSNIPPFYRLSVMDAPFSSPDDYISTLELIKRSLYQLLRTMVELRLTDANYGT